MKYFVHDPNWSIYNYIVYKLVCTRKDYIGYTWYIVMGLISVLCHLKLFHGVGWITSVVHPWMKQVSDYIYITTCRYICTYLPGMNMMTSYIVYELGCTIRPCFTIRPHVVFLFSVHSIYVKLPQEDPWGWHLWR